MSSGVGAAPEAVAVNARVLAPWMFGSRRAVHLLERNFQVYRRSWVVFVSGFLEPVFYLLSISVGIGKLAGPVQLGGRLVTYTQFVAPALMATSAMNGAVMDAVFGVFFKLKYAKVYDAVLATPLDVGDVALGEIGWAVARAGVYSAGFLVVMSALGASLSPWAVLALPASVLVGFAFAAVSMAAATRMRSWQDFDFVNMTLIPMFLFSATFYPLSTYPPGLRVLVRLTPLYQGIALNRAADLGRADWALVGHVAYLVAMAVAGLAFAARRLGTLLRS